MSRPLSVCLSEIDSHMCSPDGPQLGGPRGKGLRGRISGAAPSCFRWAPGAADASGGGLMTALPRPCSSGCFAGLPRSRRMRTRTCSASCWATARRCPSRRAGWRSARGRCGAGCCSALQRPCRQACRCRPAGHACAPGLLALSQYCSLLPTMASPAEPRPPTESPRPWLRLRAAVDHAG